MNAFLTGTLRRIEDSKGAPYLAVVIEGDRTLLDRGWAHLTALGLDRAVAARHARDGADNAHVTIANVAELGGLMKYKPDVALVAEQFVGVPVEMELHGIGKATAQKHPNTAWYGILSCDAMAKLRADLGMRPKDFHVTLAFEPKDVFDSAKDLATLVVPLTQLAQFSVEPNAYDSGPNPC